jgi:2-amino-4-hydroxy-6-hydroxymethyldihydropteridine diphosphokinase
VFLARRLDEEHTVYVNHFFPKKCRVSSPLRHRVVIGVGGNVGDTKRRMHHVWVHLGKLPYLQRLGSGVILKNPPFGYTHQADFYNTVMEVATSLSPRQFLRVLWRIEKRFGRVRSFANAPRTLDLDMLFFEGRRVNYPELIVPHPHWAKRLSVVIPLKSMVKNKRRRDYENLNL